MKIPATVPHRNKASAGFSLVEVALAIGIVSFCLVALLGLMPVGLTAVKTARDESAASDCLDYLAATIRRARPDQDGLYEALGAYAQDLTWKVGQTNVAPATLQVSYAGTPATRDLEKRLVARIEILPPPDSSSPGAARVSVAWPPTATWSTTASNWQNAEGSVSAWLILLPNS